MENSLMMITEMSSTTALLVVALSKKLRFQREFFISPQSTATAIVVVIHTRNKIRGIHALTILMTCFGLIRLS